MMTNHVGFLTRHPLMTGVAPGAIDRVARSSTHRGFDNGSTIFAQGDAGDSVVFVMRGQAKICTYTASGREIILNTMAPGDMFGEIALLDGGTRTADAVAVGHCEALIVPRQEFMAVIGEHPALAIRVMETLCVRLRDISERFEDIQTLDMKGRLAKRIVRMVDKSGPVLRVLQPDLARHIGASREMVCRTLKEFERSGAIEMSRGSIRVLNRAALAMRIDADAA